MPVMSGSGLWYFRSSFDLKLDNTSSRQCSIMDQDNWVITEHPFVGMHSIPSFLGFGSGDNNDQLRQHQLAILKLHEVAVVSSSKGDSIWNMQLLSNGTHGKGIVRVFAIIT